MVLTVKDNDEHVIAYAEVQQVGRSGYPQWGGEYVWVHDVWIHQRYENLKLIEKLIRMGLNKTRGTKYMYFKRSKYGGRVSRLYTREQLTRRVQHGRRSTTDPCPATASA